MNKEQSYTKSLAGELSIPKWKDYIMLVKLRLSLTVVFTSLMGYLIIAGSAASLSAVVILVLGGTMITFAANALNQVLEQDFDSLMKRTANRPLAAGRMKTGEAVLFGGLSCLVGVTLLSVLNPLTAILGMLSFILYAFVYTPLKRYTTLAVAIGAIPGALPVLIGCAAFNGEVSTLAFSLFMIQFLWQFPHFWAIGFLGFDDYKKAGYKLLPVKDDQIDRNLGFYSGVYTLLILPILVYLLRVGSLEVLPFVLISLATLAFAALSVKFHEHFDRKSALVLMFGSFFYMPAVLIIYLFG